MKNKNLLLKLGLLVFGISGFGISFTSAVTLFHLNLEWDEFRTVTPKLITDKMMYVHFADNGNNFWWILYFSNSGSWDNILDPVEDATLFEVAPQGESAFECRTQVKWFYYDAERGERLWPLDSWTFSGLNWMAWLNTTWWIYTSCTSKGYNDALLACKNEDVTDYQACLNEVYSNNQSDGHGYYWYVGHSYSWQYMNLTVWVEYTGSDRFITIKNGSKLSPTFVRLDNKYPVWFVYDYNGWLGLAWCRFETVTWWSMKDLLNKYTSRWSARAQLFHYDSVEGVIKYDGDGWDDVINCSGVSFADTLTRVLVEWVVWVTNTTSDKGTIYWIKGNQTDTKTQWFDTQSVNTNTLMNYTRRKAELLCRWKWTDESHVFAPEWRDEIICWNGWNVSADQAKSAKSKGQTLIVKRGDVTIKPMETYDEAGNYDIYILSGNLLVDERDVTNDNKFVVDKNGYPLSISMINFNIGVVSIILDESINITHITRSAMCASAQTAVCDGEYVSTPWISGVACPNGAIWNNDGNVCEWWMEVTDDTYVDMDDVHGFVNYVLAGGWEAIASIIKWNFIVNWKVKSVEDDSALNNKYFIYGKFTSNDSISELEDAFAWSCNGTTRRWTDGHYCPEGKFQNYALVVIDQNYNSPILSS